MTLWSTISRFPQLEEMRSRNLFQADHNAKLELEDERDGIKGTKEWCNNVAAIAAYKERALEALGQETNGWHWDGFRRYFSCQL